MNEKEPEKEFIKVSVVNVVYALQHDTINPMAIIENNHEKYEAKGFQFRTSNVDISILMNIVDYYSFVDSLLCDVLDSYEKEYYNTPFQLEALQDYLRSKVYDE